MKVSNHNQNYFVLLSLVFFLTATVTPKLFTEAAKDSSTTTTDASPQEDAPSNMAPHQQSCRPLVEVEGWRNRALQLWNRRRRKPELAYQMMILSTMSYWDFHKRGLPDQNTTEFGLLRRRPRSRPSPLFRICNFVSTVVEEAAAFPPIHFVSTPILTNQTDQNTTSKNCSSLSTDQLLLSSRNRSRNRNRNRWTFQYWLFDWHERGMAGVKFHDTDVLIATSTRGDLTISFGGTASAADAVTNIQTFEPANHSGFYHGGGQKNGRQRQRRRFHRRTDGSSPANATHVPSDAASSNIEGSLHRGFLNAYAHVDRGSILRLCRPMTDCAEAEPKRFRYLETTLHEPFGNCTSPSDKGTKDDISESHEGTADDLDSSRTHKETKVRKRRKYGGCFVKETKLSSILQELASTTLRQGRTVHVTGHSLGGGLATHLVLDLVVNFPAVPVHKLHLWTFGAPQVADTLFLTSAVQAVPRLGPFVQEGSVLRHNNGQLHRYVTLSDACQVDVVSEVAKRTLPSHQMRTVRGRAARRLGGVQGHIIHFAQPHYLLTPRQYDTLIPVVASEKNLSSTTTTANANANATATIPNEASEETNTKMRDSSTTTHSSMAAHATINYLLGISRESRYHPLGTDLPEQVKRWMGEISA